MMDRDNVGLIVILKQPDEKILLVATTHLLFNPGRGDLQLA